MKEPALFLIKKCRGKKWNEGIRNMKVSEINDYNFY